MSISLKLFTMRRNYNEQELREMISNLRLVKSFAGNLANKSELELVTYELLLENHLSDKYNDFDEWFNKLINKNGTTEY